MQTHASICSQRKEGGRERGEGGGEHIRRTETTDLDHVLLEFTFEFH